MATITDAERSRRIKDLLAAQNKQPPEKHEVVRLPSFKAGESQLCHVISIRVDDVLLNHESHRLRSQLHDDPEWEQLAKDPHSEAAQRVIERHVREARTPAEFKALRESLQREGQKDAGVMTHEGFLINANTRVVALRELDDPRLRYINVAVLPETALPEELALLELRLQMQKELKVDYSLTNELLFIEELSNRGLTETVIAQELRIHPESEKKGATEVRVRLKMLDLLRALQAIPKEPLPLSFFDDPAHKISYEQLRELIRVHQPLVESDPEEAARHLETFLLSVAVGVTPVHQLRRIDTSFMADYMVPQLEEDEVVGPFADALTGGSGGDQTASDPRGVDLLSTADGIDEHDVDVRGLIDIVTQQRKDVHLPGTPITLVRDDIVDGVKTAIITGIGVKRNVDRDADRQQAPLDALRSASTQINRCIDTLKPVAGTPDLDAKLRRSLEAAHRKLRRSVRNLETTLTKADVIKE